MDKICCFFGHRAVENLERVRTKVMSVVRELIEKAGYSIFLFGGFGAFDELSHEVVTLLKNDYPYIQRVYCVSDERYLRKSKRPKYLQDGDYEQFIYLALSYDYWYTRIYYRNCAMIDRSDYVVFYAEERENSGAYKALRYAVKQKKPYINLF